jgi:hypothetical protein
VYTYYSYWGININEFINLSEFVLLFLSDVNIIIVFLIGFLIHQIFGTLTLNWADQKIKSKGDQDLDESIQQNYGDSLSINSAPIYDKMNQNIGKITAGSFFVLALFLTFFFWSNSLIFLYLSFGATIQSLFFTSVLLHISENIFVNVFISVISLSLVSFGLSFKDVKNVYSGDKCTLYINEEPVNNDKSVVYLGKTNEVSFIYNNKKGFAKAVPNNNVDFYKCYN